MMDFLLNLFLLMIYFALLALVADSFMWKPIPSRRYRELQRQRRAALKRRLLFWKRKNKPEQITN